MPKSSKSSASKSTKRRSESKPATVFALAALDNDQLDVLVAAKEALSEQLLSTGTQAFAALSAATSPAPADNVVGVGIGEKVVDGRYTGVMSVKLLVRFKYGNDHVLAEHRLPESINGLPTDVEEVGTFRSFKAAPAPLTAMPQPRVKIRPAPPGTSVGFRDPANQFVMAGTFGALVKRGQKRFVLSNNHVLADENRLPIGSPIFQPGFLDAGNPPNTDQIAQLSAFV